MEEWSPIEVQTFIREFRGGKWAAYATYFENVDGFTLVKLPVEFYVSIAHGEDGYLLYADVIHSLSRLETKDTKQTVAEAKEAKSTATASTCLNAT